MKVVYLIKQQMNIDCTRCVRTKLFHSLIFTNESNIQVTSLTFMCQKEKGEL